MEDIHGWATYGTQKMAGSWIAVGVFRSHAALRIFNI